MTKKKEKPPTVRELEMELSRLSRPKLAQRVADLRVEIEAVENESRSKTRIARLQLEHEVFDGSYW